MPTTPVVVDLQYNKGIFTTATATAGTVPGAYTVTAQTAADLAGGDYTGTITARLCQDAACTNAYANTTVTFNYTLTVKLQDWQTFQRNASHTGYVHVTLDHAKFAKAWEWNAPASGSFPFAVNPVASGGGNIILTRNTDFGFPGTVIALDETSGAEIWRTDIPGVASQGSPAYSNGKIFVPTVGTTQNNATYVLDAAKGAVLFNSTFFSQWSIPGTPTPFGDQFYIAAGYFGGEVSGHSQLTGDVTWRSSSTGGAAQGSESTAVDDRYVYYNTGQSLMIFNRATGTAYANIADPSGDSLGHDYYGGPMIGANQSVISFSTRGFGPTTPRVLTRFDIANKSTLWRTASTYVSHPAYAKGFIYTAKNATARLDVLNESDGSIAWSWTPPATDSSFVGNIVVTDNLIFASTDKAVYAIDLTTRQSVWSYPVSGSLTLSPGYKLYIQPPSIKSLPGTNGRIVAISLR